MTSFPTPAALAHPSVCADDSSCPAPVVLASSVPGSVPCSGCGAALRGVRAVDYRDALCGRFLDSVHRP